jgi:hypothetical protein
MAGLTGSSLDRSMLQALYRSDIRLSRFNPLERVLVFDDFNSGTHG